MAALYIGSSSLADRSFDQRQNTFACSANAGSTESGHQKRKKPVDAASKTLSEAVLRRLTNDAITTFLGEAADYARQGQVAALRALAAAKSDLPGAQSAEVEDSRAAADDGASG